jgi:ATP-dependent Clp protease ATP-binding subunit ClpC
MFDLFTDRARKVVAYSNLEAQRLCHEIIDTEHVLLAFVKEGHGEGAYSLRKLRVKLRTVQAEVDKLVPSGPPRSWLGKPRRAHTARVQRVYEYAIEESRTLHHNSVGTGHILIGLIRERDGVAGQVLRNLGLTPELVREEVFKVAKI